MAVEITHLSYSSVSAFQLCPKSWWWRYIARPEVKVAPALLFGTAIHSAVEYIIRCRADQEPIGTVQGTFETAWDHALTDAEQAHPAGIDWGNETPAKLRQDGVTMLTHPDAVAFFETFQPLRESNGKLAIEKQVELSVPGVPVPLVGYIDAIDSAGICHDFKSSGRAWSQQKAADETQATYYLAALNQAGFPLNRGLLFRYLILVKPGKTGRAQVQTLTTSRNVADLFRLFRTIAEVWRAIEAESFIANTTTWKHNPKYCEFWPLCPAGGKP